MVKCQILLRRKCATDPTQENNNRLRDYFSEIHNMRQDSSTLCSGPIHTAEQWMRTPSFLKGNTME